MNKALEPVLPGVSRAGVHTARRKGIGGTPPAPPSGLSVTVNWSNVTHTMPNHFAFVDVEAYINSEYNFQGMRDMMFGLGAEGYRVIAHLVETGTPSSQNSQWANRINVIKYLSDRAVSQEGRTVGVGFSVRSGPANLPSQADPRGANDFQSSGTRSPTNHKDWLAYLKNNLGLNVEWMEYFNEPGTQGTAWWTLPVSGYGSDLARVGQDWAAVHIRQFTDPIIADSALHGTTRLCTPGAAGAYDGEIMRHLVGQGWISSSVFTDSNINHFDSWSDHSGYGAFRSTSTAADRQAVLNCAADPTWQDGNTGKSGYIGTLIHIRSLLDSNGGTAKTMDDTEWQPDGAWTLPYARNWMAGVMQTLQYILAFNYANQLKLKSKTLMAASIDDRGNVTYVGGLILGTSGANGPYQYSVRAYNLIQQVHPYSRKYKQQVQTTINENPLTPSGTLANPQKAIHCAAGKDNNNNGGMLLANIDLTNSRTITISLSSVPSSITRTRLLQTDVNGTPLGTSSISAASQFSITLEPGEVTFLELPA